jgi:hypothetical protein
LVREAARIASLDVKLDSATLKPAKNQAQGAGIVRSDVHRGLKPFRPPEEFRPSLIIEFPRSRGATIRQNRPDQDRGKGKCGKEGGKGQR